MLLSDYCITAIVCILSQVRQMHAVFAQCFFMSKACSTHGLFDLWVIYTVFYKMLIQEGDLNLNYTIN